MLLRFAGLTASGVSFWAVVSRLTLTTLTEPAPRVLKLGVPGVVTGASRQAVTSTPAAKAVTSELENRMQDLRKSGSSRGRNETFNRPPVLQTRNSEARLLGVFTTVFYLPCPNLGQVAQLVEQRTENP